MTLWAFYTQKLGLAPLYGGRATTGTSGTTNCKQDRIDPNPSIGQYVSRMATMAFVQGMLMCDGSSIRAPVGTTSDDYAANILEKACSQEMPATRVRHVRNQCPIRLQLTPSCGDLPGPSQ